jgi:hypothetical protein
MAGPLEAYVQLPTDASNTGKKVRTQSRVVSAQTVHEHYLIPISTGIIKGVYFATSTLYTVTAAASNGTTTAVWWLQVPANSIVNARVRRVDVCMTNAVATAIDLPTAPRFAFSRFTHNGGWSGAILNPSRRKTTDNTNQADVRTASTGTTVTLGTIGWAALIPGNDITTSGVYNSFLYQAWQPLGEEEFFDLAPGEGMVAYQADAGTASDQRRLIVNVCWDEYDNQ